MLLDILNMNDYISFNVQLARIFGLTGAVYLSELLSIYRKAIKKNKLIDDNYFKLDRVYMRNRTTISLEDQLKVDDVCVKNSLMYKHNDNPDILKLDVTMLLQILSTEDEKTLESLTKCFQPKKTSKETKKVMITKALQDSIKCSNYELLTALRNWVDSICSKPNGFMSKAVIETFQKQLNDYTKGDLDLALRLVEIAIIQGYKDCQWAINVYERDLKFKKSNQTFINERLPRVTEQKVATIDTISNIEF